MCGIVGFINFNCLADKCWDMTNVIAHRGLDDKGIQKVKIGNLYGYFGHRRLSIFDLSNAGHQPMTRGEWTVVFNGEIYNFRDLRKELETKGCRFSSESDTEVICYALEIWGVNCIKKFNGMFAIAATNSEALYLFRDRNAVKPLYYFIKEDKIAFSSEIGAFECLPYFEKKINEQAFFEYLSFGYVPAPLSIYENTYKLMAGYYLKWQEGKIVENKLFHDQHLDKVGTFIGSERDAVNELERIITDAVKIRLIADRSVGCWLSGGIDSSLTCAIAQKNHGKKLESHCIRFEQNEFDESVYAQKIAKKLGVTHHTWTMNTNDLIESVYSLPEITGEPFSDSSILPTLLLSKITKESLSIVISGDGGDEFFWGYPPYWLFDQIRGFHKYIPNVLRYHGSKILKVLSPERGFRWGYKDISELHTFSKGIFSYQIFSQLTKKRFTIEKSSYHQWYKTLEKANFNVSKILPLIDQKFYMSQVLTKVDLASMHYALEVRSPLLDYRVTEFANSLPDNYKVRDNSGKYILKKLLTKYLPVELFDREKQGFGPPINYWLADRLNPLVNEYLFSNNFASDNPYFNMSFIKNRYQIEDGKINASFELWTLLQFEIWRKQKGAFF